VSIERAHRDHYLLAVCLCVLAGSVALGAALGASRLGLYVPPSGAGSIGEATSILVNNLEVWALLVGAALFQPRGIPGLTSGFLPLWLADLAVALVLAINLIALGGVLGALGFDALLRISPHAPLEIGAYFVAVATYLRARDGRLDRGNAIARFSLAAALLVCGSGIESYVSGALG
jgi:hypothetical protein